MTLKKGIFAVLALFILLASLVQFPSLFINKANTYKAFDIYSNTPLAINDDAKIVFDSVLINLEKSHFQKNSDQYHLYFIKGTFYEQLLGIFGMKNIASSKYFKHIYIAQPLFSESKLMMNTSDHGWLNLVQIITHEAVHSQMYADHSNWGFMQTPAWINEGYAEYISYQPIRQKTGYQLSSLVQHLATEKGDWLRTEHGAMTPRFYTKSRVLVEYLLDIKGKTITELIADKTLNSEAIYEEVVEYFSEN